MDESDGASVVAEIRLYGQVAAGRVALVDDADYELVSQYRWHARESSNTTYAVVSYGPRAAQKWHRMHCLIIGSRGVDHRNRDGLDNRRENLRGATGTQNAANSRARGGTSCFKGVSWDRYKRRWRAQVTVNRRNICLGRFASEADAARAYDAAALAAWGVFARLNFPVPAW